MAARSLPRTCRLCDGCLRRSLRPDAPAWLVSCACIGIGGRAVGDGRSVRRWAILTELERQGWIELPASERVPVPTPSAVGALAVGRSVEGGLRQYRPLRWELVSTAAQRREWRQLLAQSLFGSAAISGGELEVSGVWAGGPTVGGAGMAVSGAGSGLSGSAAGVECGPAGAGIGPCGQRGAFSGIALGESGAFGIGDLE